MSDVDPEFDSLTQMALELLVHSILLILDRQAKDQLPSCKYADPSPELITGKICYKNKHCQRQTSEA